MERNVNYVIVGFFVAAVLLAIAGFMVWLAGTHDIREYDRYTVYFDSAVNGLADGGQVRYRGVAVGRVLQIRLTPDRPDLIKVDIEVDKATPVRAGTRGFLKPQGITGLSFIGLKTEDTDDGPPKEIEDERYPVIKAEASGLEKIFEDAPELIGRLISLADNLNSITSKIDMFLNEKNMEHVSQTMVNIEEASAGLKQVLNEENGTALRDVLVRAETVAKNLDRITAVLAANQDGIDRFTREGLNELTYLIRDSRGMVTSIKNLADALNEDPSRIIFQPNYDGVKIEK